ncbi:hypothetical protein ACO0LO_23670 [Undibacterium sp. TJN25]|uniref:hypothetical protein n=1 Tax=Undibacterium sp. TJN25 TaxID=3413056 RepID=UPI003BF06FAA
MKHGKILAAALAVAVAMNLSFAGAAQTGVPKGWTASFKTAAQAETGFDPAEKSEGHASVYLEGKDAAEGEFVALTQTVDARPWQGQMVEFSLTGKSLDGTAYAQMWIRGTDGGDVKAGAVRYKSVGVDWIRSRDWKKSKISMIIPKEVTHLELGAGIRGKGKIWIRDIQFRVIPALQQKEVEDRRPVTDLVPMAPLAASIVNLGMAE